MWTLLFILFTSIFQDKILISGDGENQKINVTNDGATILKSVGVDNPAAKVLVGLLIFSDNLLIFYVNICHLNLFI